MIKLKSILQRETHTVIGDKGKMRPLILTIKSHGGKQDDTLSLRPKGTQYELHITLTQLWHLLEHRYAGV